MNSANLIKRKLNFKPSPKDPRDFTLRLKTGTFPNIIDLSGKCTSVKDQGSVGSCTAHASVAMYEYIYRNSTSEKIDDIFSEKFTYYTTRVDIEKGLASEDSGAYVRDALKSLVKYGTCKETSFPYLRVGEKDSDFAEVPSPSVYQEALRYQGLTYVNVPDGTTLSERQKAISTIKGILSGGNTLICGFICYDNLYDGKNGVIPLPTQKNSVIGGHSVCLVGYNDQTQMFKFKNSWGPSWGDKGYGYISYQYLLSGNLSDVWSLISVENDNNSITIMKPSIRKQVIIKTLKNGLISIANDQIPLVPSTLEKKDQDMLRSTFNRVTLLKTQVIPSSLS